jgi:SpoVK/Ycf46/Vps4 family AAA+-type ATPase
LAELLVQLTTNKDRRRQQEDDQTTGHVVVIAATNRVEDLDEAVVRRFECKIYVGVPNLADRRKMLDFFLSGVDWELSDHELHEVSMMTESWSGSEIESLCREAAMAPLRDILPQIVLMSNQQSGLVDKNRYKAHMIAPIRFVDFQSAYKKLLVNTTTVISCADDCDNSNSNDE